MRLGTKATAYGVAGLVLAGAVIFSGSTLGLLSYGSSGVLSILITDPPSVPSGVSAVYITYSDLAVHAIGFGDSGWVRVPGQGTIETMGLVNLSRTISIAQIPALTYNLVRFNISNAHVEFMGQNYSVRVNAERLTVAFAGGLRVNSSSLAAALVDISPTVLNFGNQSDPNFTMAAGAHALQVPSDDVGESMKSVGTTTSLQERGWFQSFRSNRSDNLTVSGLALTATSLSFSASNPGSNSLAIKIVMVTQDQPKQRASGALGSAGSTFAFAVQPDGSLKLVNGSTDEVESLFEGPGYSLAGGATHLFSYSGAIVSVAGGHTISEGTAYTVVVMSSDLLSAQSVIAA